MTYYKNFHVPFYKFIYKRSFLEFSSVELFKKTGVNFLGKIETTLISFKMYVAIQENTENDISKDSLKFSDIKNHFKELFLKVTDNTLELNYFKKSYIESLSIDQNRYMNLAMNFEKQFNIIHNNKFKSGTNNAYNDVKILIMNNIEKIVVKEKKKKKYKQKFKEQIERTEGTFEEKVKYSLSEYEECLIEIFKRRLKMDNVTNYKYSEISTTFSEKRNLIAHGEIIERFSSEEVVAFIIIYLLLYCMILKSAGIENVLIKELINEYTEF